MIKAYPLQWPVGKPRTKRTERSRFTVTFSQACKGLMYELRMMEAKNIVISTNVPLKRNGLPYTSKRDPDDIGVAVYFEWKGKSMAFSCDRWDQVKDNIQAIQKTVSAIRGMERWGTGEMVEAAFSGFTALPPTNRKEWWEVLRLSKPTKDHRVITSAFRRKAHEIHPDAGGNHEQMQELNAAREEGMRFAGT